MSWAGFVVAAALAQSPITLDQAREQARANTQALVAAANRESADAAVMAARAPLLPQVTASAGGHEESDPSVTGAVTICTSK